MNASVLDLRNKMSEIMAALDRQERVTLTYRGRKKAVIIPCQEEEKRKRKVAEMPAFGMWKERPEMQDPEEYVRKLREGREF